MASGFDTTSFSTGLLDSVNQQYAKARQQADSGDADQYRAFQEAAHEYDQAKAKQVDQGAKVNALANVISGGKPDPAAYATARDAVELGYTQQEHLPYVLDAYKRTKEDMVSNPEKWTGVAPQKSAAAQQDAALFGPEAAPQVQDTNPAQTNIIRKFDNKMSPEDIENIRAHKLDRPYQGLPGANWGASEDTNQRVATEQSKATHMGTVQAESTPEALALKRQQAQAAVGGQLGAYGYQLDENGQPVRSDNGPMPNTPQQQQGNLSPQSSATPQGAAQQSQPANPIAIPASSLQPNTQAGAAPPPNQQVASAEPPPSNAGISLNAPPPQASTGAAPAQLQAAPQPAQSNVVPPVETAKPNTGPQYPASSPTIVGSSTNYDALEKSGFLNAQALERLTPPDQAYVRAIVSGNRQPPPPYSGARNAHTQLIMEALNQYDPSYSDGRFGAKNKFLEGPEATNLRNLNTAYNHMGLLAEAADQVSQSNLPALNKIANALGVETGKSAAVVFDNIKHYVSSEMRRFYTNGKGGLAELETIAGSIDKNQSPEQINAVMGINLKLLDGAADSYDNQYHQIMGNAYEEKGFLSKTAQNVRDNLMQKTANAKPGAYSNAPAPDFSHLWSP